MPSISTVRLSVVLYVQLSDTPGDVTGSVPVWARPRLSVSASDRTDQVNQVDCTESMGGKQWFIRIGATTHITCFKVRKCPNNTVHESTGYRSLGKKEKIRGRKAVSEQTVSRTRRGGPRPTVASGTQQPVQSRAAVGACAPREVPLRPGTGPPGRGLHAWRRMAPPRVRRANAHQTASNR